MKSKKILISIILVSLVAMILSPVTFAQTDSLAVWENIADGTLSNTWYEVDDANWKGQNDSGTWEYNNTMTNGVNFTINATYAGDRWFKTYEFTSEDDEYGVGDIIAYNSETDWYAVMYWLNGPDDADPSPDATPACYVVWYVGNAIFYYWNGTDFEWNVSNATDYSRDLEKDYTSGNIRVKSLVNHNELNDWCTVRWKCWEPSGDEINFWMVDTNVTINNDMYPQGLCIDGTEEPAIKETDFSRIFFWNLSYDIYTPGLPIYNTEIACPTITAEEFYNTWDEYIDTDDIWNQTQLFKQYINLYDLNAIYTEDFYGDADNQNDTTYVFSMMMTDTRDFFEEMFGPGIPDEFPDNTLGMYVYNTPDASQNESDYMLLRIDTDNNDLYDSYDYAIWSNDTDLYVYQGWTPFVNPWFADMYGGPVFSGEFGEVFRDDTYFMWQVYINWDMIFNGSSGERVGTDICRMSIGWYDNDTNVTLLLQDFDETDDDYPYPATDGRNLTLDPTWEGYNDSSNWVYFYVDESISGDTLADPIDGFTYEQDIDDTTRSLIQNVLPILIAVFILIFIVSFALTTGLTKESLMTIMIVTILGIVLISIIIGL